SFRRPLKLSVVLLPCAEAKPSSPPLPLQGEDIAAASAASSAQASGAHSSSGKIRETRRDINRSPGQGEKGGALMIPEASPLTGSGGNGTSSAVAEAAGRGMAPLRRRVGHNRRHGP